MWKYNYTDELCHHGTKGMKWGQRLYQRKDGSLTALGKKRYSKNQNTTSDTDRAETVDQKKARILKSHSAKEVYKNKDLFSDKELNDAYNRLNTEKNIQNLIPKETSKGQKFIETYVNTSKTIKSVVDSSDSLYESYIKGKNLLDKLSKGPKK